MEKYVVDGQGFNVGPEDLQVFLEKYPNAVKYDEPGKTTDSAIADPTAESNVMGSESEDGSLEQPEISAWENIKNNLSNSLEMSGDVAEFWGVVGEEDEGAQSGLSIASTMIWEGVFGKEKMKEFKEQSPNFFSTYDPSDSKTFQEVLKNF